MGNMEGPREVRYVKDRHAVKPDHHAIYSHVHPAAGAVTETRAFTQMSLLQGWTPPTHLMTGACSRALSPPSSSISSDRPGRQRADLPP